eukprot:Gb_05959 [translate_table: standard]
MDTSALPFSRGCCNVFCTSNLCVLELHSLVLPRTQFKGYSYSAPHNVRLRYRRMQKVHIVRASSSDEGAASETPTSNSQEAPLKKGNTIAGPKKADSMSRKAVRSRKHEEKKLEVTDSGSVGNRETTIKNKSKNLQLEEEDSKDGEHSIKYDWPPLVCCFGAAQNKFIPITARQTSPDVYSTANGFHWNPAEFVRARGGPPSNVAIALACSGGRVAFMGKVGNDPYGRQMVVTLNMNNVQTRGVRVDSSASTSVSYMKLSRQKGKVRMTCVKPCAEDSFLSSEINVDILKEARMFYFNSMVLLTQSMRSSLFAAIKMSKKYGGDIFFDVNLPLPLWRSRVKMLKIIQEAWNAAHIIEVSRQELEYLLDERSFEKKRKTKPRYSAESDSETKQRHENYHYTREEISPLWHDNIKLLLVNDGNNLHYYTQTFDGSIPGVEEITVTPFTCDRSASGDAVVADIMRKVSMEPELYSHQVYLEKALRRAVTSGIVAQWEIGRSRRLSPDSLDYKLKKHLDPCEPWVF